MRYALSFFTVFLVLFFDQLLKFWVKTSMYMGEEISILGDWFYFHFIENDGMAFGMSFGGINGKLFLSFFRILAVAFLAYFLLGYIRKHSSKILIISLSLILAGAIGNIIDSVFYGVYFSESNYFAKNIAEFMPAAGGYNSYFMGNVVDMLYFPIIKSSFPSWFPFWSGEPFIFFQPIFNIADAAISIGAALLLIFQRSIFKS